jgi:spore germination cell wall hydrolase CwlJ-like protein
MALGVFIGSRNRHRGRRAARRWALVASAMSSASCVPVTVSQAPALFLSAPAPEVAAAAEAAPPAAPLTAPLPAPAVAEAGRLAYAGRSSLDGMRALDCLAQAIYYEAGRESEDGQRAVAQVVLNRVRHPAWPDSVCGVIYQGPMRAGGGCQFTFTCDGALLVRPGGEAWARARRLAAEALAGYVYRPVGQSTHYHANYVYPSWAPTLRATTVIGAHLFYSLPGPSGSAAAFTDAYVGVEPFPRPAFTMMRRPVRSAGLAALTPMRATTASTSFTAAPQAAESPSQPAVDLNIREEYRQSGQWRTDAPEAIRGH